MNNTIMSKTKTEMVENVNHEMMLELVRDLTAHLREARDERVTEHKLAMLDGGIALELIDRGEAVLRGNEPIEKRVADELNRRGVSCFAEVSNAPFVEVGINPLMYLACGCCNETWDCDLNVNGSAVHGLSTGVPSDSKDVGVICDGIIKALRSVSPVAMVEALTRISEREAVVGDYSGALGMCKFIAKEALGLKR
jgi:hypothetical protein